MRKTSIWLTFVILATVASFLLVFKPITFSPRTDPSDSSRYLKYVGAEKNFNPQRPLRSTFSWGKNFNVYLYPPQHDLRLGLDLRGGMRVVLQIPDRGIYKFKFKKPITSNDELGEKQAELIEALKADDVLGTAANDTQKVSVIVRENDASITTIVASPQEAEYQLEKLTGAMTKVFGSEAFTAPEKDKVFKPADTELQTSVMGIMEKRLNGMGTSEIVTYAKGINQVVIEIPGVKDPDRVKEIIGTTAEMQFRLVPRSMMVSVPKDSTEEFSASYNGRSLTQEEAIALCSLELTGSALSPDSKVTYDQNNKPAVGFSMRTPEDRQEFANLTGANINAQLAIVLDNKFVTAPTIQNRIDGNGIITGNFTVQEAQDLALLLNAGALPVPVDMVENRTVSATLGADSIDMSMKAGLIGLLAVLIFMFAYYRLPGLMANLALIVYISFSLAVLWLFDATLTLPGIAGLIISIGMAVDANVIIFERLKEELRSQKPLETAIDVAFARAWTAILDSNVASLITGGILYALGTGAIRGFAVTLMIGVAVSLITAVSVTRLFMKLMIRTKAGHNLAWYGV